MVRLNQSKAGDKKRKEKHIEETSDGEERQLKSRDTSQTSFKKDMAS